MMEKMAQEDIRYILNRLCALRRLALPATRILSRVESAVSMGGYGTGMPSRIVGYVNDINNP